MFTFQVTDAQAIAAAQAICKAKVGAVPAGFDAPAYLRDYLKTHLADVVGSSAMADAQVAAKAASEAAISAANVTGARNAFLGGVQAQAQVEP